MTRHRSINFLEFRAAELRAAAKERRRRLDRFTVERSNIERAARDALDDAHRLEREADGIEHLLDLIRKSDAGHRVSPDVAEAAEFLRANPLPHRETIVLGVLRAHARGRMVEATWNQLCTDSKLGVKDVRESTELLARMGLIDLLVSGRGALPSKWLLGESVLDSRRSAA